MTKMVTHMWFADEAEEAAEFYVSLLPKSRIDRVYSPSSASSPAEFTKIVDFTLAGQPFMAINAGKQDPFNHAISLMVQCKDQEEIDALWTALLKGGAAEPCGWLTDRYGVSWQIVPEALADMLADDDQEKAARALEALMKMEKIDLKTLKKAHEGK